jgi:hypothetical protein
LFLNLLLTNEIANSRLQLIFADLSLEARAD